MSQNEILFHASNELFTMKNTLILLLFALLILCGVAEAQTSATIKAVHDGDSYRAVWTDYEPVEDTVYRKVERNEWLRIQGVDCPELYWPGHTTRTQPFARAIGDSVRSLIKGKTVEFSSYGRDVYGRLLVKITLPDGRDLADVILRKGWGVYIRNDLEEKQRRRYQRSRDYAKKRELVIWSDPERIDPEDWREKYRAN